MRLIDADKLKRKCQKVATEAWKMKIKASAEVIMNQFIDFIDEADTVDIVPVRCKDCLHFCKHDESVGFCKWSHCLKRTNGYCDDAERKDGDHEAD